jgi:RNA polymerase sigma-70 factor (ECF subfamily)
MNEEAPPRSDDGVSHGSTVPREDRDDIAEIYEAFFGALYGYCVYRLFSRDQAEDAASAVFLRLVEEYPRLKGKTRLEIRQWLYGAASNVAASYLRDSRRKVEIHAELIRQGQRGEAPGPGEYGRLDWPVLYQALGRLKRAVQDIVVLRCFQGLETSEIADILGMKHVTVRVQLSRAVRKLRLALGKSFGSL